MLAFIQKGRILRMPYVRHMHVQHIFVPEKPVKKYTDRIFKFSTKIFLTCACVLEYLLVTNICIFKFMKVTPMNTRSDRKLSVVMNRFMRQVMMMERQEKLCWGVTLSQHYVIDALYRRQVLTMNALSKEVGLAVSTLTRVVDVLVRDDVIARKHSEEDRRKVYIELTNKGRELAENLRACAERFWGAVLEELPNTQKKAIAENLRMLLTAMDKVDDTHCPKTHVSTRKIRKKR